METISSEMFSQLDLIEVKDATYLHDYQIQLTFSDGVTKIVDLKEKLKNAKGIFVSLRDMEIFKDVKVNPETGTIEWSNGADWAPDTLYSIGRETPESPIGAPQTQNSVSV